MSIKELFGAVKWALDPETRKLYAPIAKLSEAGRRQLFSTYLRKMDDVFKNGIRINALETFRLRSELSASMVATDPANPASLVLFIKDFNRITVEIVKMVAEAECELNEESE